MRKTRVREIIELLVLPADGLCEGCGAQLGEEVFETEDSIVVCKGCFELCLSTGVSPRKKGKK